MRCTASTAPSPGGGAGKPIKIPVKSRHLVEGALHAGPKRRNGFGRHFLSESCKLLGLLSEAFDLQSHVRNRQLEEFRKAMLRQSAGEQSRRRNWYCRAPFQAV